MDIGMLEINISQKCQVQCYRQCYIFVTIAFVVTFETGKFKLIELIDWLNEWFQNR